VTGKNLNAELEAGNPRPLTEVSQLASRKYFIVKVREFFLTSVRKKQYTSESAAVGSSPHYIVLSSFLTDKKNLKNVDKALGILSKKETKECLIQNAKKPEIPARLRFY